MRLSKKRKPKARNLGFGMAALYALVGSGCGLEAPPPSFIEQPQAYVHFTMEGYGEDELLEGESDDAPQAEWQDDDILDAILDKADDEIDEGANSADARAEDEFTGTGSPDYGNELEEFVVRLEDIRTCARLHGANSSRVVIASPNRNTQLERGNIVVARVTGNASRFFLRMDSSSPSHLRGICIFAAGNQSEASIEIENISLDAAVLIARGNKARIHLRSINANIQDFLADLAGNQPQIKLEGLSPQVCNQGTVRLRGSSPDFQC